MSPSPDTDRPTEPAQGERPLLVTSALPYANGPIHFGHIAGAYLPADIYTRFQRLRGRDVLYICGTDEHGVSITVNAEKQGVPYAEYVAGWHTEIKALFDHFAISFDHFGRTSTDTEHHRLSQEFFLRLLKSGAVTPAHGRQHYCTSCERYLPDRYVEGTCYVCGKAAARGDECKACGSWLEAVRITEPTCVTCGNTPEVRDMMQYELDLSHYFDATPDDASYLDARFLSWRTRFEKRLLQTRRNAHAAIFEKLQKEGDGLHGRPITRDLRWGVPLPATDLDGATVVGHEGKVLYVWFDAPIGYISATIEWARRVHDGENDESRAAWRRFWIDTGDDADAGPRAADAAPNGPRLVHFLGKDNIPFHGVVFPGMLSWQARAEDCGATASLMGPGPGERWVLPENVPANEFYNLEGKKFSTSDRWALDNDAMFERFGVDALRWYLTVSMPETSDSQFRFENFADVVNAELNDTLGNYASRVQKFVHKIFDGRVPEPDESFVHEAADASTPTVKRVRARCEQAFEAGAATETPSSGDLLELNQFRRAADRVLDLARSGNADFDAQAPWKSRKLDDLTDCRTALWGHLQQLSALGVALWPFMPAASDRLRASLGQRALGELLDERGGPELGAGSKASLWRFEELRPGRALGEPGTLFSKIDKDELEADKPKLLPAHEGGPA